MEIKKRNTKQRELLLQCFEESCCKHISAEELYELAKEKGENIGIATVYRNLKFFEEQGIIKKVLFEGNKAPCYELNQDKACHAHHHLICTRCGSTEDFEGDLLDKVEKQIEKDKGFKVSNHQVAFYGICQICRTERGSK